MRQIEKWFKTQIKRGRWPSPVPTENQVKQLSIEKFHRSLKEARTADATQLRELFPGVDMETLQQVLLTIKQEQ